jgi:actin-like ATPase involved in cell morphogenesis
MSYDLGVDLGTTYTAAAVRRGDEVRMLDLGTRGVSVPSVVFLKDDETTLVGEAAQRRGVSEGQRVAREFKRRLGDTTPIILGSTPYSAEALMARLLRWVVDQATQLEGGPPGHVTVTHPANWGDYKKDLLHQAIRIADIDAATVITEPEAAVLHYASQARIEPGRVIAVYDLGGGTFDAAVLRKTEEGFHYLGTPEGIERLGGIDFDEAVFNHVQRALAAAGAELDPDDPQTVAGLRRLRDDCVDAKEALSADSDVSIPVVLPSIQTDIRLTRAEFEAMIRPSLADSIGAMERTVRSAGISLEDLDAILLVGGSSRIPLVGELVGGELGVPVVVDTHPKHAIALGAAMYRPEVAQDGEAAPPPPPIPPVADAPGSDGAPTGAAVAGAAAAGAAVAGAAVAGTAAAGTTTDSGAAAAAAAAATEVQPPVPPPPAQPQSEPAPDSAGGGNKKGLLIGGVVAAVVALGVVGFLAFGGGSGDDAESGTTPAVTDTAASSTTDTEESGSVVAADPVATEVATTAAAAATPSTEVPTTPTPTSLFPPETRQVEVGAVTLNGSTYEVTYDTLNFVPDINGGAGSFHIHFFWDIYPADTVGVNAAVQNPWTIWDTAPDGTLVYTAFGPGNQPFGATAICAVVATNGHEVDQTGLALLTSTCAPIP